MIIATREFIKFRQASSFSCCCFFYFMYFYFPRSKVISLLDIEVSRSKYRLEVENNEDYVWILESIRKGFGFEVE